MDLTPTTELEAVNQMLAGIGESPINSLDSSGSADAEVAQQTLHNVSRDLQERGWHWNTLEGLTLSRTVSDNEILLPANTLKVDTVDADAEIDVIQRGKRLFNKSNNSYKFDKNIVVDLVEFLPFDELPQAARIFVYLKAKRLFQEGRVGSDTLSKFQQKDEMRAWAYLLDAEAETKDATVFDNPAVMRALHR